MSFQEMYGLQWFQSNNKELQFIWIKAPDFQSGRPSPLVAKNKNNKNNNNNNSKHCKQN